MTNAEIIQAIRNEIERLKEEAYNSILPDEPKYRTHYKVGKKELCEELLSFLSTLESEKPMDGLEEEIDRIVKCEKEFMNFQCRSQLIGYMARHFAQWGAEHLKK